MKELSISRIEMINKLPEDIVKKIYLDHFKVIFEYERIMKCVCMPKMYTNFCHAIMIRHMRKILDNNTLLQYFIKHDKYFANVYYRDIEPNIKQYDICKDIIVSHAMSWIICTNH
jgi:hypothetical protein